MTTYESKIKSINASAEAIFAKLSDLEQLRPIVEQVQDDRIKNINITSDSIYCTVDPVGEIGVKMIETEPCKTIKFASEKSPIEFNMWIQLVEKSENDTCMKLTIKADLPIMFKMMLNEPLSKGIDILAENLSKLPY
ncbi:MAG: SRPBCC family protein [Bacteroidia bacterium]|nr:SRPBCC family protein [Bacteroidia bacterium]